MQFAAFNMQKFDDQCLAVFVHFGYHVAILSNLNQGYLHQIPWFKNLLHSVFYVL